MASRRGLAVVARVSGAARALPTVAAAVVRRQPIDAVVLAYHDVTADRASARDWSVSADQLRSHLQLLHRMGYRVVDLAALTDAVLSDAGAAGLAAVVFDDALVGVYQHALPVLVEQDVTATAFAVTGAVGVDPPWWPGSVRTMTQRELAEWTAAGHRIAAHTKTHPSLPGLPPGALHEELVGARDALEQWAAGPVDVLAYPYGHHDRGVREAVVAAGYRAAYTFLNGRLTGREDPLRLPRLTGWSGLTAARLAYALGRPAASYPDHQGDVIGPVGSSGAASGTASTAASTDAANRS